MTHEERLLIQDLEKCDFGELHAMHKAKVEARKNMTKEEKLVSFTLFFPPLCCVHYSRYSSFCYCLKVDDLVCRWNIKSFCLIFF